MSQSTDYVKRILKVLIYIEDHFNEDISMDQLAKIACQSLFHFHRVFQAIVGETVYQYIRRLRLEKAAGRLLYTDQPITEIALESNYDTPSAFTRAFKQCMGKSPRDYRELYKEINKMTKKINELPMIKPDKVEKMGDISLLFIRKCGNYVTSSQSAWKAMWEFIKTEHLDPSKLRYISISHDDPQVTNEEKLRFDACITIPSGVHERGEVARQVIKGGRNAIFIHKGALRDLSETFDRIFLRWLPDSRENFDDTRTIFCEHFNLEYKEIDESKLITNIYIPIV